MRIILSQKGVDSGFGGKWKSPIIDNKLFSFPIPEDKPLEYPIKYSALNYEGRNCFNLMSQLGILTEDRFCHLDPDIRKKVIDRYPYEKEWQPLFGQVGMPQAILKEVEPGDIFLFYGLFKQTEEKDGKIRFVRGKPERHIIYGYFQIDEKITLNSKKELDNWMHYHPHNSKFYRNKTNNTIYVSRNSRAGTFDYDESLILSKENHRKKSHWDLHKLFQGYLSENEVKMLRLTKEDNKDVVRWKKDKFGQNYYESPSRPQEKIIRVKSEVDEQKKELIMCKIENWVMNLILEHKS